MHKTAIQVFEQLANQKDFLSGGKCVPIKKEKEKKRPKSQLEEKNYVVFYKKNFLIIPTLGSD